VDLAITAITFYRNDSIHAAELVTDSRPFSEVPQSNASFISHKHIISKNKVNEVSLKEQIFIFVGSNKNLKAV
jgi:hypothetical protein